MSIKVVVELNEAFMDLQWYLMPLPRNVQSERLRTLASIGLQIEDGRMKAFVSWYRHGGGDAFQGGFLKFPVYFNEAYPELLALCNSTPTRLRAERIRSLASIGLNALSSESAAAPATAVSISEPITPPARVSSESTARIKTKPAAVVEKEPVAQRPVPDEVPLVEESRPSALINLPVKPGKRVVWLAKALT
ncbi:hypothetical protein [Acidovorax delafieldii]|uniref:hypothetical protein n=1 Tax=Acidovorax delafieldii TaxID=47920 RepID=UPI0012FDA4A4|nr:hypothetical protein [Acidovorax delafieldii]